MPPEAEREGLLRKCAVVAFSSGSSRCSPSRRRVGLAFTLRGIAAQVVRAGNRFPRPSHCCYLWWRSHLSHQAASPAPR